MTPQELAPMTTAVEAAPGEEEGDDYDDPRYSSAAQSIQFRILGEDRSPPELLGVNEERSSTAVVAPPFSASSLVFAPEFTHQVFPGEWIRGYQPISIRRDELLKPHRSFVHHILATHEASVKIDLAPDCATCRVAIRTAPLVEGDDDGGDDGSGDDLPDKNVAIGTKGHRVVGSGSSPLRGTQKRPRRHASMVAGKRMKTQSQDEAESVRSDASEDDRSAESNSGDLEPATLTPNSDDSGDGSVEGEEESHSYVGSSEECDDDDDFDDDISHSNEKDDGETRSRRMTLKEIREALAKALPPMVPNEQDGDEDDRRNDGARPKRRFPRRSVQSASSTQGPTKMTSYLSEPIGSVMGEPVTAKTKNGDSMTFVLALADGSNPRVADYHGRIQRVATWFIETADEVDVANRKDGGYWKILYVFRRHDGGGNNDDDDGQPTARYSLAGYMTLYHFRSPFRKPKPGIVVRICQALVLPPYQRMRLGQHMLNCVYDLADQPNAMSRKGKGSAADAIVEFNVEDPAPAFTALRNCVDYDRFRTLSWFQDVEGSGASISSVAVENEAYFTGLSDAQASEASAQLRITPTQVHIVHELEKLRVLNEHELCRRADSPADATTATDELLEKRYRLMVKKRLNRQHREDLGGLSKLEAQRVLGDLFDNCLRQYQRLLRNRREEERR